MPISVSISSHIISSPEGDELVEDIKSAKASIKYKIWSTKPGHFLR
jgi:hypothetical protein